MKPKTKIKPAKIPEAEKDQVRARKAAGHDFALKVDVHGRHRLVHGTTEAKRLYDLTDAGYIRVRTIDPLKGISSLTEAQRTAGAKYRETFEYCTGEGARGVPLQERVDGGRLGFGVPEALSNAHGALASAKRAIGHHEIEGVVEAVCCHGTSLRELSALTHDPREALLWLLRIGLDNLAFHYGIVPRPKQKA